MDYARYETAKLADLTDAYYFGVHCPSCLRSARLSLERLRAILGDDFPTINIRKRLKCSVCGSKAIIITFLAPNQAVGDLARLFQQKPV